MKLLISTTALSLLLGTSAFAMQSQDDKDKEKPAPKEEPKKQDQPNKQDNPDREKDKDRDRRQPDNRQPDRGKPEEPKQQQGKDRDQQDRDRAQQQQDRERQDRARGEERNQPQREDRNRVQTQERGQESGRQSGGRGRRIPDDRFRAGFGRQHTFHVQRGGGAGAGGGAQRFQYGGYWFEYTEAWPGDWGYDDDFYIDYVDDDYYLYDLRHPGVRVLVIVVE